ncbi:MAG: type II secretion system protein [Chloroflexi bacterium]|nr:type II secretion system protein [Chloroflexota bacterium]
MLALRVHRSERGVTLAEVLVSLIVLSIVGLTLLYGILMSSQASQMAQIKVEAEGLARSALEDVRAMPYRADAVYTLLLDYPDYPDYSVSVTATKLTSTYDSNPPYTENVIVTVTYLPRQVSKVDIEQGIISLTAPGKQVITITTFMVKGVVAP